MSESLNTNKQTLSNLAPLVSIMVLLILAFAILISIYIGGYLILPNMIQSAFQDGNCTSVLAKNDFYLRIYPFANTDENSAKSVRECAVYVLGITQEDERDWEASYNAYSVYVETYPQGTFINEVHEHSAVVLMELVKEDVEQENYSIASLGLDFVLENFADTPQAVEADMLKSELRMALGAELRKAGDFAAAEQIFHELGNDRVTQLELAQTYLAWGLELQAQKKFAEAQAKFEMAISTDPDRSSAAGPAAQAKTYQADLYTQWGDDLIEEQDFGNAMELYKLAASFVEDQAKAGEIVATGYVQWATALEPDEDLQGALVLLDFALESSYSDSIRELADDARSDLYLAFSKSDGEDAQKAIDDAIWIVCQHQTQPGLPIFGLDQENIRFGVDGTEKQLPESITAKTPGSLHFVACVEEDTKIVETRTLPISNTQFGGSSGVTRITYANFQYIWNVVLRKVDSGKDVESTIIEGPEPEALKLYNIDIPTFNYFGPKPDISDLADWILTVTE